jgi:hypothetical protein
MKTMQPAPNVNTYETFKLFTSTLSVLQMFGNCKLLLNSIKISTFNAVSHIVPPYDH